MSGSLLDWLQRISNLNRLILLASDAVKKKHVHRAEPRNPIPLHQLYTLKSITLELLFFLG